MSSHEAIKYLGEFYSDCIDADSGDDGLETAAILLGKNCDVYWSCDLKTLEHQQGWNFKQQLSTTLKYFSTQTSRFIQGKKFTDPNKLVKSVLSLQYHKKPPSTSSKMDQFITTHHKVVEKHFQRKF